MKIRGDNYPDTGGIEDIIAVLDGRPLIVDEVKRAEPDLIREISERFHELMKNTRFIESISGHLPADETSQARVAVVLDKIKSIAEF